MSSPDSTGASAPSIAELVEANRRLGRQATVASLLAVVSLTAVGALAAVVYRDRKGTNHHLSARSLTINDSSGNARVWVGVNKTGPGLSVMSEEGKTRIWAGLSNDSPSIGVFDKKGENRVSTGLSEDESAYLIGKTSDGKAKASMGVSKDSPYLELRDKQGKMLYKKP
jgi:hypothetical protein